MNAVVAESPLTEREKLCVRRKYHISPPSPFCKVCGATVRILSSRDQGGGTSSRYCSTKCIRESRRLRLIEWHKTPRGKFISQKNNAKRRGIAFQFSFDEWLSFWGQDVNRIGKSPGMLVMGRYGDIGPYHPRNCYKSEFLENLHQPPKVLEASL